MVYMYSFNMFKFLSDLQTAASSLCPHTAFLCAHTLLVSPALLPGTPVLLDPGSSVMTSRTFIYLLKGLSPSAVTSEVGLSHTSLRGHNSIHNNVHV